MSTLYNFPTLQDSTIVKNVCNQQRLESQLGCVAYDQVDSFITTLPHGVTNNNIWKTKTFISYNMDIPWFSEEER